MSSALILGDIIMCIFINEAYNKGKIGINSLFSKIKHDNIDLYKDLLQDGPQKRKPRYK